MFYISRFNAALRELGLQPKLIDRPILRRAQIGGQLAGLTPQEAALILASDSPDQMKSQLQVSTARSWIRSGYLDMTNALIVQAIVLMDWMDVLPKDF